MSPRDTVTAQRRTCGWENRACRRRIAAALEVLRKATVVRRERARSLRATRPVVQALVCRAAPVPRGLRTATGFSEKGRNTHAEIAQHRRSRLARGGRDHDRRLRQEQGRRHGRLAGGGSYNTSGTSGTGSGMNTRSGSSGSMSGSGSYGTVSGTGTSGTSGTGRARAARAPTAPAGRAPAAEPAPAAAPAAPEPAEPEPARPAPAAPAAPAPARGSFSTSHSLEEGRPTPCRPFFSFGQRRAAEPHSRGEGTGLTESGLPRNLLRLTQSGSVPRANNTTRHANSIRYPLLLRYNRPP